MPAANRIMPAANRIMNNALIPRKILFGNPHRTVVRISPDGEQLSYLADHSGVLNVWVAPANQPENTRVVTRDRSTGISQYFWAYTNRHILYLQDQDGDEDFHLYCVDLDTHKVVDLTPFDRIAAQVNHLSHRHPGEILVGINDRDEHWFHDIYRINIETGERTLIVENNQYIGFIADDDLVLKFAITLTPESDLVLLKSNVDSGGEWLHFMTIPAEEIMTTSPIGMNADGTQLYMTDSRDRNTAALTAVDIETGEQKLVFATDIADVNGILTHPAEKTIQAVTYTYDRTIHKILDPSLTADFETLKSICDGELEIASQTIDQTQWIVAFSTDNGPVRYYRYERHAQQVHYLFSSHPELEKLTLAKMHPAIIRSRDGLNLVSYLTLPTDVERTTEDRPAHPLPMVLLVHGGPWWRDHWGFDPVHQLLANRGYAVLSVNFRGSTGFGKSFINAANLEWGGKMHDDLIDAVHWAIGEGIADRARIAIMGGSYGGFATLIGLAFTPEVFACGVDIVGPSSLITLMENPPPYWMPIMPLMTVRVGDYQTEAGRIFLASRSPISQVEKIKRPLLIGQGGNDPRVKQSESDQIVAAMNSRNIPVTYVLYPDEGHGFDRPENDISFYAICELFLSQHLGGQHQAIGEDFCGAKFEVLSGADNILGLTIAMAV